MDKLVVKGPARLSGSVRVSGSKNASLPILAATLLATTPVTLSNLPGVRDVRTMLQLLKNLGCRVTPLQGGRVEIDSSQIGSLEATYDLVKTMRASILVLGPLLTRYGQAKVSLPGGCAIGARPVDIHLQGLKKMGAHLELTGGYVEAYGSGLVGAEIILPFPSVGATENLMMAATTAKGTTVIKNAACEPEIIQLEQFLNSIGAKVSGAGTHTLVIEGTERLYGGEFEVGSDRIEASTYLIAGIMTNSPITITHIEPHGLEGVMSPLVQMGANFKSYQNCVEVLPRGALTGVQIKTSPYPGFPTDVQAQFMALTACARGPSVVTETIFENRFMHVPELIRLGAKIVLRGGNAYIEGGAPLCGAPVMCTDLRASAALVLAGLVAEGETEIRRVYHLDRGYERLDEKLRDLGVDIRRINAGLSPSQGPI